MNIENVPFMTTDWSKIARIEHPGETGMSLWRTLEIGNIRVRLVEYTPGYLADHWLLSRACSFCFRWRA